VSVKDKDHPSNVIATFVHDKEARNAIIGIDGAVVNGQRLEFVFL